METNSETGQKPDEQIGMHARTQTHTQTEKMVNLAWQAEFVLPVGMIMGKLGYRVICLINVALQDLVLSHKSCKSNAFLVNLYYHLISQPTIDHLCV